MTHITLSAAEARAVLDGSKTQFRVRLKPQPDSRTTEVSVCREQWMGCGPSKEGGTLQWDRWRKLPYAPGDEVWVREAFYLTNNGHEEFAVYCEDQEMVTKHLERRPYFEWMTPGMVSHHFKARSPVTMPRWASRITLLVKSVRVERVQDISEADAIAEGCRPFFDHENPVNIPSPNGGSIPMADLRLPVDDFHKRWIDRHGAASWDANDWVEVVEFERITS
mgnify:CR=1 FL=1